MKEQGESWEWEYGSSKSIGVNLGKEVGVEWEWRGSENEECAM